MGRQREGKVAAMGPSTSVPYDLQGMTICAYAETS
jgi:hypothetical protein